MTTKTTEPDLIVEAEALLAGYRPSWRARKAVIEVELLRRLVEEVKQTREALKAIQHRCGCCVTNKECSQAVLDIDTITRKALRNEIRGYQVGGKQ